MKFNYDKTGSPVAVALALPMPMMRNASRLSYADLLRSDAVRVIGFRSRCFSARWIALNSAAEPSPFPT
jgi:hypothetical protein